MKKQIFLAYRQNALFEQYLAELLNGTIIGQQYIIPIGAEFKDHKEALLAAMQAGVKNGIQTVVCDDTCAPHHFYDDSLGGHQVNFTREISLNRVFSEQVRLWTKGETIAGNLGWFAGQVAVERNVKKVVVVQKAIADHELVGQLGPKAECGFGWFCRDKVERAALVKEVLVTVFGEVVEVVPSLQEAGQYFSDAETMIVADRHSGVKDMMEGDDEYHSLRNWKPEAMLLTLPFETCAEQLINRGTFPYRFDMEKMKEEFRQRIV